MFDHIRKAGATSQVIEVMLRSSTTGGGATGIAYTAVTASYCRAGGTRQAITLASGTAGDAYSSGKWAEVDATNQKGLYQLHVPDAAIAAGAPHVTVSLQATGVIDKAVSVELIAPDLQDTVRLGLTALPNAAAEAAGGLVTRGTGTGQINPLSGKVGATLAAADVTGNVAADVKQWNSTTLPIFPTNFNTLSIDANGKVTGKLATADVSGNLPANAVQWDGGTLPTIPGAAPTAAAIRAEIDANSTKLDVAVSTRMATASYTAPDNASITAIKAKTDNLPSDPADQSAVEAAISAIPAAPSAATIRAEIDSASTQLAAIKAKTDTLPSDPADESSIQSTLSTIASYLDTEIAAIKTKTDNLPASPASETTLAAVKTKTDALPAAPAAVGDIPSLAQIASEIADALNVDTYGELPALPGDSATIVQMLRYLYQLWRYERSVNKALNRETIYKSDSLTQLGTAEVSDDGNITVRRKVA